MIEFIFDTLRERGHLSSNDRHFIRKTTFTLSPEEASAYLQTCVCTIEDLDNNPCPPDLRKVFKSSLQYGSIVDDLCDVIAVTDKRKLNDIWSNRERQQECARLAHLQNAEMMKCYMRLKFMILKKCRKLYEHGLLRLTYPEIDWEKCSSYHVSTWSKFQPEKMSFHMRAAFVYATRDVVVCRAQNEAWIHKIIHHRTRWWSYRKTFPRRLHCRSQST